MLHAIAVTILIIGCIWYAIIGQVIVALLCAAVALAIVVNYYKNRHIVRS